MLCSAAPIVLAAVAAPVVNAAGFAQQQAPANQRLAWRGWGLPANRVTYSMDPSPLTMQGAWWFRA
jgi:hypothetical protein